MLFLKKYAEIAKLTDNFIKKMFEFMNGLNEGESIQPIASTECMVIFFKYYSIYELY